MLCRFGELVQRSRGRTHANWIVRKTIWLDHSYLRHLFALICWKLDMLLYYVFALLVLIFEFVYFCFFFIYGTLGIIVYFKYHNVVTFYHILITVNVRYIHVPNFYLSSSLTFYHLPWSYLYCLPMTFRYLYFLWDYLLCSLKESKDKNVYSNDSWPILMSIKKC